VRTYPPHKYAVEDLTGLKLKYLDKVKTITPLPGVPVGTKGKVILANGLNWLRYRVLFENGEEIGHLDFRHLVKA
jgi:hypothetical protein